MTLKERHKKVEENLGLVHSIAKRFSGKGVDYEDIVSAGCIGLIKAIDNFDESLGFKLSTYAVPAILGEIKRIWRDGGSIKVSRKIKELSLKAAKINEQSIKENGRELTVAELSLRLSASKEDVTEALSSARLPLSLSGYSDEDDEQELCIPIDSAEESLAEKLTLKKAIDELSAHDRNLITLRYFESKTQSETAKILGTTQVQISRKEKKILAALRLKMSE
ncbi:MAG: sigma-70 family RNA polymerase sigma factor [Ruminococcus sp.]|nr:sigma-70 family RNA polymerase sigma factor [Ruminococcus sp.]